jgi:hypothetical protein
VDTWAWLADIWTWLKDPQHLDVLVALGGGLAAIVAGIWAVIRHYAQKRTSDTKDPRVITTPSVGASNGSIAVGRDVNNSNLSTSERPRQK